MSVPDWLGIPAVILATTALCWGLVRGEWPDKTPLQQRHAVASVVLMPLGMLLSAVAIFGDVSWLLFPGIAAMYAAASLVGKSSDKRRRPVH